MYPSDSSGLDMAPVLHWRLPDTPDVDHKPKQPRKRKFATKAKTGCNKCKTSHLRCDEGKPTCSRCLRAGWQCVYTGPRPWLFEPSTSRKSVKEEKSGPELALSTNVSKSQERWAILVDAPLPSPSFRSLPLEEKRALRFWRQCTSPWLANYSSYEHRKIWDVVFPRCAMQLPATRHLVVAVALLDEQLPEASHGMLMRRSKSIIHHYNAAIRELTADGPAGLDVALATILAWVLEIMLGDQSKARMHLDASKAFLEKIQTRRLYLQDGETRDILMDHVMPLRGNITGFSSSQNSLEAIPVRENSSVLAALIMKHRPSQISSPGQARDAFANHLASFDPLNISRSTAAMQETTSKLDYWKWECLKHRYQILGDPVTIVAIHLLYSLSMALLDTPTLNETSQNEYPDPAAMDYILDKSEDFLALQGLCREDRAELERTLAIVLTNILRFSRNESHRKRATNLLQQYMHSSFEGPDFTPTQSSSQSRLDDSKYRQLPAQRVRLAHATASLCAPGSLESPT